jgi:hypothetical protein
MFITAIETADAFTRPVLSIMRVWGSETIIPGAATLFFVNTDGWALTCKHVVAQLQAAGPIGARYGAFKAEFDQAPPANRSRRLRERIAHKHGLTRGEPIELHHRLINCVEGPIELLYQIHPRFDLALIKFNNFTRLLPTMFPIFAANHDNLKQGKTLCRLGFPFPEFSNFELNQATDQLQWTDTGRFDTPRFPIEGMVTRHLIDEGRIFGFEMSTPGLRGQSGGPAFDVDGRVWGMQFATRHLDLDFDVDMDVLRNGDRQRVRDHAFLHVGCCIHVQVLKAFMRHHNITFQEG